LLFGDDFISEVTKTRVDAVDHSVGVCHHVVDDGPAFLYPLPGSLGEIDVPVLLDDGLQNLGRKTDAVDEVLSIDVGGDSAQKIHFLQITQSNFK
jgi:hypothetical protein